MTGSLGWQRQELGPWVGARRQRQFPWTRSFSPEGILWSTLSPDDVYPAAGKKIGALKLYGQRKLAISCSRTNSPDDTAMTASSPSPNTQEISLQFSPVTLVCSYGLRTVGDILCRMVQSLRWLLYPTAWARGTLTHKKALNPELESKLWEWFVLLRSIICQSSITVTHMARTRLLSRPQYPGRIHASPE